MLCVPPDSDLPVILAQLRAHSAVRPTIITYGTPHLNASVCADAAGLRFLPRRPAVFYGAASTRRASRSSRTVRYAAIPSGHSPARLTRLQNAPSSKRRPQLHALTIALTCPALAGGSRSNSSARDHPPAVQRPDRQQIVKPQNQAVRRECRPAARGTPRRRSRFDKRPRQRGKTTPAGSQVRPPPDDRSANRSVSRRILPAAGQHRGRMRQLMQRHRADDRQHRPHSGPAPPA